MAQEKILELMREEAAKEGRKLNLADPEQWTWNNQLEARVRRENPGADDTPGAGPSVNKSATAKASALGNMRDLFGAAKFSTVNQSETYYALTGCELETKKEPVTISTPSKRITFAVSNQSIRMPILPSVPGKTVDGRDIPQSLIDAVLSYDVNVRPAILKLNTGDGHSQENGAALGRVDSTYSDGNFIWAIVSPAFGAEDLLKKLLVPNGMFPYRSIEADVLTMADGKKQLWLEAIAMLGSQKPALNLPPAEFSKSTKQTWYIRGSELR
jgi:hypothetical protein